MEEVLRALLYASERAANIARSCCTESARETLLVAEKGEGEANSRFDKDFKTIADVLAQESARHEISLRCPNLAKNLRGEECAEINGVTIKVCGDKDSTAEMLSALVPPEAAKSMADAVHKRINVNLDSLPNNLYIDLNPGDLGVWVDPIAGAICCREFLSRPKGLSHGFLTITTKAARDLQFNDSDSIIYAETDATAEFIAGVRGEAEAERGLPCVTVLIGAYIRSSGIPVVGVINQPFVKSGQGRIIWGISYGYIKMWSERVTSTTNKTILMSSAENPEVIERFKSNGWEVKSVPGAGHKLLTVATGEAAAYLVSKGTTFRWDTCAPHAILKAQGGEILSYDTLKPITYNDPVTNDTQQYANTGGIIAYTNKNVLDQIKKIIDK